MGELKAITGHTRARRLQAYLERGGRALARDFINLAPPLAGEDASGMPAYGEYRWAAAMDATREAAGNDLPWRGRAARTWKHYVISPDPRNAIALPELRELACSWAERWFPDNEVAIVYHDDNPGRIPHAHVVVNNTCLSTGRRMQVPDPLALNRSLQEMEAERGLEHHHPTTGGKEARPRPRTRQRVHVRRAERELAGRGRASWVADIRSRVEAGARREPRARLRPGRPARQVGGVEGALDPRARGRPHRGARRRHRGRARAPGARGGGLGAGAARRARDRRPRPCDLLGALARRPRRGGRAGGREGAPLRQGHRARRPEAAVGEGPGGRAAPEGGGRPRPAGGTREAPGEGPRGQGEAEMILEITYEDGREDVFDTDRIAAAEPFGGGAVLTEFRIRFDRMEEEGLWVEANFYEARAGGGDGAPAAARRRGWRAMLADPGEVGSIVSIHRDGRPRYWRLGGTLVDDRRLSLAERLLDEGGGCGLRRALRVDAALSSALPDLPPDEVCALYGACSRRTRRPPRGRTTRRGRTRVASRPRGSGPSTSTGARARRSRRRPGRRTPGP
ncbi:relaxase/mobilization nuclease domain-containing protein [Gordonibacter sp. ResAG-5]|nr:relaxase/mobilization nuclease domain-containing protein [Gordonibacter urolithinfaciens]MVN63009.1 relaxase/mobilization nuclease domain-containing protein [Gordonibacter urolithinfaciens]